MRIELEKKYSRAIIALLEQSSRLNNEIKQNNETINELLDMLVPEGKRNIQIEGGVVVVEIANDGVEPEGNSGPKEG